MKNNKKNVYRSFGFGRIAAPNSPTDNPSGYKFTGKGDLRVGNGK